MSIIKKMRKQKAVYWARLSADEYGVFAYDDPVQVDCRWDDMGVEFRNVEGEVQVSQSVVYVDRVMAIGDKLQRGEMDSTTPDSPAGLTTAFEIRRFDQNPNLRATETLYTAYL